MHVYIRNIEKNLYLSIFNFIFVDLSKRKMAKERGTIEPNFHLRVSLSIIYFLGTWPPHASKYRILYRLYTVCSFIFLLGILLAAEIANVFANWGDMSKILAFATILMTNSIHASKVNAIIFNYDFYTCRKHRIIKDSITYTLIHI